MPELDIDPEDWTDDVADWGILEFLAEKVAWSAKTFGPGKRTEGVCRHIESELAEIRKDPDDLYEWIDVILLALDGAQRLGYSPRQVLAALYAKQDKNVRRKWPPPNGTQDTPSMHVKEDGE